MSAFKIAVSRYKLTEKIPPGSEFWPKFNASFENLELETPHILQRVYDGQSITTWHRDAWRHSKNYICGQHLGLDFDNGDITSSINHLVTDKFIMRYGSFVYTTISHTDECPKARVIFMLDQPIMQAKNYALAASALLWLFGTADRSCRDAARFFYGAKGCKFEYIDQTLPLEVIKKLIQQYQETGQQERRSAAGKNYLAPASQKEVEEALDKIPAWDVSYDEWVEILMAIHSEFGEAGLGLAVSWGKGYQGEVERKWKSFHGNGNTAGAVTIATVFGLAKQHGWSKYNGLGKN